MNKMRKMMCVLLALLLATAMLAGCQQEVPQPAAPSSGSVAGPASTGGSSAGGASANTSADLSDVKIALVMNYPASDGGWCQSYYESMLRCMDNLNLSEDQVIMMEDVDAFGPDAESVFNMLAQDDVDLIIAGSSGFTEAVNSVASRYPDVHFAVFEGQAADNIKPFSLADHTAMFMCGYAVARMSETDELGFVACQPQASVVRSLNAFSSGARYANENATVKVLWANSWYDPAKEKEATNTFINEGKNAIGFFGGTTAVANACGEQEGVYTNGLYLDMHDLAPSAMVTSMVYTWETVFEEMIHMVAAGQWDNEIVFPGIAEGGCDVAPFNEAIMPADVVTDCQKVREQLINGEVEVFPTPVMDNQGNEILAEGEEFSIEDYITMLFLLDNVVGSLP
ncbi:BMP family ABC transporter substrate-binding protein [Clostridia bacterium OttesenSCG-928-O13]|nr:BMP family ABC transporter substrate-binding protein [Clostridia bacterium OttesenSCG-928-O13]